MRRLLFILLTAASIAAAIIVLMLQSINLDVRAHLARMRQMLEESRRKQVAGEVAVKQLLDLSEARLWRDAQGGSLPYRLFRPIPLEPGRKYPLVLFLHGSVSRGDDNVQQVAEGAVSFLRWAAPESQGKYPCFMVAPQCPLERRWVYVDWSTDTLRQAPEITPELGMVAGILQTLPTELPVDPERIYIIGQSMGGFGAWDLITRFPDRYAAAAPLCAGGDETLAYRIKDLPIWAFHGEADGIVRVQRSRIMVQALRDLGGNIRYSEYPGLGHEAWTRALAEPQLQPWLFDQVRGRKSTTRPVEHQGRVDP